MGYMTTSTLTLTDFLLARIAEDEAERGEIHERDCDLVRQGPIDPTWGWECSCAYPARVLAECDAKRRMIERWEYRWMEAERAADDPNLSVRERGAMHGMFASQATGAGYALGFMAAVYADHPDYREEWRA